MSASFFPLRRLAGLLLVALLAGGLLPGCQDEQNVHLSGAQGKGKKKVGISSVANLTVRSDPFVLSTKYDFLAKGEQVDILNVSRKKDRLGKHNSYWYKIRTSQGIIGWVYGAYLNIVDAGDSKKIEEQQAALWDKEGAKLKNALVGQFISVNNEGIYTAEKLIFYPDGNYKAGRGPKNKYWDGTYTILPSQSTIELSQSSTVGKKIAYVLSGDSVLLYGKAYGSTVKLVKVEDDPEKAFNTESEEPITAPKKKKKEKQAPAPESGDKKDDQ